MDIIEQDRQNKQLHLRCCLWVPSRKPSGHATLKLGGVRQESERIPPAAANTSIAMITKKPSLDDPASERLPRVSSPASITRTTEPSP